MDRKTQGAWIIHHGKKIAGANNAAANFSTIDLAAKSGALLSRMAGSEKFELDKSLVETLAKAGGLNPKTELPVCLAQLEAQQVIGRAKNGAIAVIGVTASSALDHTASLFEANEPEPHEKAAIGLGELVSRTPVDRGTAKDRIGDEYHLSSEQVDDVLDQSANLGFVESDEDGQNPLLFNGNLFRRDSVVKTKRVLDGLSSAEQRAFSDFEGHLKSTGAQRITEAERILGTILLSKLRAAGVFDENIVSNEAGDHSFITLPGSFHKFSSPMIDDAFDHAKALVAALSYGMHVSSAQRGRVWGVDFLLRKLLRGESVGPAPAIGKDYRALELERVVQITQNQGRFSMSLVKKEVGEIALQVLQTGSASAASVAGEIPGAQVTSYTGPEKARTKFRKRKDMQPTKGQMRGLLNSVRSGGGL